MLPKRELLASPCLMRLFLFVEFFQRFRIADCRAAIDFFAPAQGKAMVMGKSEPFSNPFSYWSFNHDTSRENLCYMSSTEIGAIIIGRNTGPCF